MKTNKIRMKSLAWALLAGASALLLAASLPLLLSHLQAQAQPVAEITADDLVVDKKVNTDLAAPGDTVTYTIIIEKTGDEITAWMTDTLPGEVTYVTNSLQLFGPGSVGFADGVITWTHAAFGWSQEAVITFSAKISSGIIYTNVVNTAQVTGTGELVENSATTVVGAIGNLDNADTYKHVSSDKAEPGDVLTYTIQVANDGQDPVPDAWLVDTLRPELTYVPNSLCLFGPGSVGFANGVITWTGTLAGFGQVSVINFSAQISPDLPYNGWITNTVEIVAPFQSFTRSVGTNVYQGYPHLEASKSVYPDWVHPGECLTYTVHIVNTGDGPVETAWMTDALPSEVGYASGLDATTGSYGVASDVITWTGSLAPSEAATITFAVATLTSLENNTCFTNTAEITGAGSLVTASVEAEAITTFTLIFPIIFYNYPPVPVLNSIPTPVDHSYTVSWQGVETDIDYYALQQARDSKFSSPEQVWTPILTSQVVADVYCAHYYRVRADKASDWGQGPWSNVEAGVASPPDPPVLSDIPDPNGNNSYTVSWSPISVDGAVVYVLQESTDAGFSNVTQEWQTTTASQLVEKGSTYGTFYYRVRADDDDCWGQGSWSGVKSVQVQRNYYDSFNNSTSGWITHDASCCLSGCDNAREHLNYKYSLHYVGGRYRVDVPLDCRAAGEHGDTRHIYPVSFAPGIERPTSATCLGLRGSFEEWDPYWSFWGLVFAASNDKSTVYSLEVNNLGDWAVVKRTGYQYPGPNHPWQNETRTHIVPYTGGQRWPAKSGFTPNTLEVSISGKKVKLYINNEEVYSFSDPDIQSLRRVGIIGGNWEITPTRIGYDYFFMDEGCDTY